MLKTYIDIRYLKNKILLLSFVKVKLLKRHDQIPRKTFSYPILFT